MLALRSVSRRITYAYVEAPGNRADTIVINDVANVQSICVVTPAGEDAQTFFDDLQVPYERLVGRHGSNDAFVRLDKALVRPVLKDTRDRVLPTTASVLDATTGGGVEFTANTLVRIEQCFDDARDWVRFPVGSVRVKGSDHAFGWNSLRLFTCLVANADSRVMSLPHHRVFLRPEGLMVPQVVLGLEGSDLPFNRQTSVVVGANLTFRGMQLIDNTFGHCAEWIYYKQRLSVKLGARKVELNPLPDGRGFDRFSFRLLLTCSDIRPDYFLLQLFNSDGELTHESFIDAHVSSQLEHLPWTARAAQPKPASHAAASDTA